MKWDEVSWKSIFCQCQEWTAVLAVTTTCQGTPINAVIRGAVCTLYSIRFSRAAVYLRGKRDIGYIVVFGQPRIMISKETYQLGFEKNPFTWDSPWPVEVFLSYVTTWQNSDLQCWSKSFATIWSDNKSGKLQVTTTNVPLGFDEKVIYGCRERCPRLWYNSRQLLAEYLGFRPSDNSFMGANSNVTHRDQI